MNEQTKEDIKAVMDGCKDHQLYRAKRKPKSYCSGCDRVWEAKQRLLEIIE